MYSLAHIKCCFLYHKSVYNRLFSNGPPRGITEEVEVSWDDLIIQNTTKGNLMVDGI